MILRIQGEDLAGRPTHWALCFYFQDQIDISMFQLQTHLVTNFLIIPLYRQSLFCLPIFPHSMIRNVPPYFGFHLPYCPSLHRAGDPTREDQVVFVIHWLQQVSA